jgi:hypothetical protein
MTATFFGLLVLAFAVGFICCFLFWQSADRSGRLLRDSRDILLTKVASSAVCDQLVETDTDELGLATHYGVPLELIHDLRLAGGLSSLHEWRSRSA